MKSDFLEKLIEILGERNLLLSSEDRAAFGTDWTRTPGIAGAVALPKTTQEVSLILKLCSDFKVSVIPSGGRTGLAGGIVAQENELALNLSRMNQMGPIDLLGRTIRVQAGATTQAVHEACEKEGLTWPIDLASKGSSEIGGNLATNAGGVRVIRYGMARRWVTALEAVLMTGEVIELNQGLEKNNTGYDLLQLLIGSEGTLAVITKATLKLCPLPISSKVFLVGVSSLDALTHLYEKIRKGPFQLTSFEFFSSACREKVEEKLKRKCKLQEKSSYYALFDIEASPDKAQAIDTWFEYALSSPGIEDGFVAESSADQKEAWGIREGITESLQASGLVRKYDLCVPVPKCSEFLEEAIRLYQDLQIQSELFVFGHFGDGSPHLNFLNSRSLDPKTFHSEVDRFQKELYPLLRNYHGSISAEHGIGQLKRSWLNYSKSEAELRLFQAIKKAWDPEGLLNPRCLSTL